MDLEPCTALEFDRATLYYASQDGWCRRTIFSRRRSEGYVNGRLVLLLLKGPNGPEHFRAPLPTMYHVPREGFRYK